MKQIVSILILCCLITPMMAQQPSGDDLLYLADTRQFDRLDSVHRALMESPEVAERAAACIAWMLSKEQQYDKSRDSVHHFIEEDAELMAFDAPEWRVYKYLMDGMTDRTAGDFDRSDARYDSALVLLAQELTEAYDLKSYVLQKKARNLAVKLEFEAFANELEMLDKQMEAKDVGPARRLETGLALIGAYFLHNQYQAALDKSEDIKVLCKELELNLGSHAFQLRFMMAENQFRLSNDYEAFESAMDSIYVDLDDYDNLGGGDLQSFYYSYAAIKSMMGNSVDAVPIFRRLLASGLDGTPRSYVLSELAHAYRFEARYESAIRTYQAFIDLSDSLVTPDYTSVVNAYTKIGTAYQYLNKRALARAHLDSAYAVIDRHSIVSADNLIDLDLEYAHQDLMEGVSDTLAALDFLRGIQQKIASSASALEPQRHHGFLIILQEKLMMLGARDEALALHPMIKKTHSDVFDIRCDTDLPDCVGGVLREIQDVGTIEYIRNRLRWFIEANIHSESTLSQQAYADTVFHVLTSVSRDEQNYIEASFFGALFKELTSLYALASNHHRSLLCSHLTGHEGFKFADQLDTYVRRGVRLDSLLQVHLNNDEALIDLHGLADDFILTYIDKDTIISHLLRSQYHGLGTLINQHKRSSMVIGEISDRQSLDHAIYQSLFGQWSSLLQSKRDLLLRVTPSFFNIAFEALCTDTISGKYLIDDVNIKYVSSPFAPIFSAEDNDTEDSTEMLLVAMAPVFGDLDQLPDNWAEHKMANPTDSLMPLYWTAGTAKKMGEAFQAETYIGEAATESIFRDLPPDAIWQVMTHAHSDPYSSQYSMMYMHPEDSGATHDGVIYFDELSAMELKTPMAVLLACQTGLGQYSPGAGTTSLSQAAMKAGAASVVESLWSIDEKASTQLLLYLYDGLAEGLTKSAAMRQAKLKLKADPDFAHPYYWAGIRVIGDDAPLPIRRRPSWPRRWPLVAAGLGVALLVWIWRRKKRVD